MTTVQNTVTDPGGEPLVQINVRITLMTGSPNVPGYAGSTDITGTLAIPTDGSGHWSANLTPNASITPANTWYQVVEGQAVSNIVVPASGGPYYLSSILVTPPSTGTPLGITGVQVAGDGTVAGVRPEINLISGANVTVTAVDNPGSGRVDVTVASSGGGGGTPSSSVQAETSYGIASGAGTATTFSRGDHTHGSPSLASIAPATTEGIGQAGAVGVATTPARADHVHSLAAAGTPGASAVGDVAAAGSASTFAASDHTHGRESFGSVTALTAFGTASGNGTAATVAHSDHVHGAPALPSATTLAAGIVRIDGTSTDIQALGTQAAGSSGLAADATHVHPMPRLDQVGAPAAAVSLNAQKLTSVANGTLPTDGAAFGQIPTSAGSIGGLVATNNLSDVANPATARGNLSAAKSGANSDITSLTGLTTPLPVTEGGTGAATLTGLVKGTGTSALAAAVAGTDYTSPAQAASTVQSATSYGVASATGTATTYAREDHQHGTPSLAAAAPATTQAIGTAAALGTATTAAKADHVHPMAAAGTPGNSAVGDAAATGVSTNFAASDHTHGREGFGAVVALSAFNTASANGTATTVAHSDHVHGAPALPTASTSTAGIVQFESVVGNLQPSGTAVLGSNGKTVDSGHVHPGPAWQFNVLAQGAKGDGKISNTGATTASSATVTIGEAVLTAGDVGKVVMVKNALNANNASGQTTSVGTITAVNSSTSFTATWNTTPTQTSTGLQVLWATDDTTAIQAAIAAANTYALAHNYFAEIYFPPGAGLYYGVGGALKTTDGTNAVFNSQLTIPVNAETNPGVTLTFRGVGGGGNPRYWNSDSPQFGSGIQSFGCFTGSSAQSTNITGGGNPSVIGGPTGKNGYGVVVSGTTPTFSNTCVEFRNFTIRTTHSNSGWTYSAANMFGVARFHAYDFTCGTNGTVQFYKYTPNLGDFTNVTLLSGGLSIGVIMPSNGNNASNYLQNYVCDGGYTFGLFAMEHTVGNSVTILYCWAGLCPVGNYNDSGSGAASALHAIAVDQACVEGCTYAVDIVGAGQSGIGPIVHLVLDTEGTVQLRDAIGGTLANTGAGLSAAMGTIRLVGSPSTVTVSTGTGAGGLGTGLQITKEQNLPGVPSSGIPALVDGTSVMNSLWRPATVYLSGGTNVTTVATSRLAGGVNTVAVSTVISQAAGALPANTPIRLGPGQWIKVTTSAGTLPTAVWVLD